MNRFSKACSNLGLTINTEKTEIMYQPAPCKTYTKPIIKANGVKLNIVNRFTYMGSTLSQNVNIDDGMITRISYTSSTFGRLHTNVWHQRGISLHIKLKIYRATVLPMMLCVRHRQYTDEMQKSLTTSTLSVSEKR